MFIVEGGILSAPWTTILFISTIQIVVSQGTGSGIPTIYDPKPISCGDFLVSWDNTDEDCKEAAAVKTACELAATGAWSFKG